MDARIGLVTAPLPLAGGGRALPAQVFALLMLLSLLPACATRSPEAHARAHVRAGLEHRDGGHRWAPGRVLLVDATDLSRRDERAVFRGFEAWLADGIGGVSVRRAEAGERADVVFRLVDRIGSGLHATGRTRLDWAGLWIEGATVELARRGRMGALVTAEERRRAIVHEIGHVLGLGHADRFWSIMHPRAAGCTVDRTDRLALAVLYAEAGPVPVAGVLASLASRSEREREDPEAPRDPEDR